MEFLLTSFILMIELIGLQLNWMSLDCQVTILQFLAGLFILEILMNSTHRTTAWRRWYSAANIRLSKKDKWGRERVRETETEKERERERERVRERNCHREKKRTHKMWNQVAKKKTSVTEMQQRHQLEVERAWARDRRLGHKVWILLNKGKARGSTSFNSQKLKAGSNMKILVLYNKKPEL